MLALLGITCHLKTLPIAASFSATRQAGNDAILLSHQFQAQPKDICPYHFTAFSFAGSALLGRSMPELEDLAKRYGQPAYRGKQIHDGLFQGARTLDAFTNVGMLVSIQFLTCHLKHSVASGLERTKYHKVEQVQSKLARDRFS